MPAAGSAAIPSTPTLWWHATSMKLVTERAGPFVIGKKVDEFFGLVPAEHNVGVQVALIDLSNKFTAAAARRQDIELAIRFIPPDGDNLLNLILTSGYHRPDRGRFSAEPSP